MRVGMKMGGSVPISVFLVSIMISSSILGLNLVESFAFTQTSSEDYDPLRPSGSHVKRRDVQTELGSFDLQFKSSSSSQSKLQFYLTPASSSSDNPTDKLLNEGGGGGGDQVQGLESGGNSDKIDLYKRDEANMNRKSSSNLGSIWYLGCFSNWEKQMTPLKPYEFSEVYNDEHNYISCADKCRSLGGAVLQISILRGSSCQCSAVFEFNSSKIDTKYCNIPCPLKDYDPEHPPSELPQYPCGGNFGFSAYCRSGSDDCIKLIERYRNQRTGPPDHEPSHTMSPPPSELALNEPCAFCRVSLANPMCKKNYLKPEFDYFPTNSPRKCVQFCRKQISFVSKNNEVERVREATTYAALTWLRTGPTPDVNIPICSCFNENYRSQFVAADPSMCNMACPGNRESLCGGIEDREGKVYSTIYCASEDGLCTEWSSSPQPTTTTENVPYDPCNLEGVECDDTGNPGEGPTTSASSTTRGSTGSGTNGTTTTLKDNTTTTESDEVTEIATEEIITSTTVITSTALSTSISTTTERPSCQLKCQVLDRHGYFWDVCSGSQGIVPCSKLVEGANGQAFWKCLDEGVFETVNPDVSNCSSSWIERQNEAVEAIKDFNEADEFLDKLVEKTKNADGKNSTSKYFGHEIRNLSEITNRALAKAKEFDPKLSKFEKVIDTAIDLNVFLIIYQEPWKDLGAEEKSSISTALFGNTEETLFHLTEAAKPVEEEYQRIFSLSNETDLFRFLILAETFDKITEPYEFPPRKNRTMHDSFIKLPQEWNDGMKEEKVEIAAMSIDPDYVSFIMPGQFENLVSASSLDGNGDDGENTKLINGKMISLSLTSSSTSSNGNAAQGENMNGIVKHSGVTFKGKGAEITFHHDIEAWGAEQQSVPRKLHDGEKPRAVLGSTECVFWDTVKNTWSSNGCHIVRSNRYETVCECSHLTSFAILMDVHKYVGKQEGLEYLTLILCPASEVALVLSIVILSSVNGLQRIRATITTNLSACLLVGNALVLFVLDRNYFNMSEGLCVGAAMITHYVFLCAFMWMLIEGVQLYRMVIHVFDSGRSYIKHFGLVAYGSPLIIITITATTGYLRGDKPYGGDVYCWLEGAYIWSFMGPVALIIMVNLIILFIALKTAYQLQQTKKLSPTFLMGRIRSCKTWFKGCFSLTVILGLTWIVGFFTLMRAPSGVVAAYLFTILNASQGLFIFLFNCVFNDKVRSFTQRNLSTYLPSWLTSSSVSSSPEDNGNDGSIYGKRRLSPGKIDGSLNDNLKKRATRQGSNQSDTGRPYIITRAKLEATTSPVSPPSDQRQEKSVKGPKVDFKDTRDRFVSGKQPPAQRSASIGTISSADSIPASSASDNGHNSSDTSHSALISRMKANEF